MTISQRLETILTAVPIVALALTSACAQTTATHPHATPPPVATLPPQATQAREPSPTPTGPSHVFLIVLENRSYDQVRGSGYIAQLAQQYGVASNYRGVSHPSLPNYLAMTSGSTWGVADDGWHNLPQGGLGAQLTAAGLEWRAYMEGMTSGCYRNVNGYALKHNPFAYYGGTCPPQVVPFNQNQFSSDMAQNVTQNVPRFIWITPNQCHDGHDCSNAVVNAWLAQTVPAILGSDAWKDNGVLFITWDEGEDSANSVLTLVIHPNPLNHQSNVAYNHYSLLATIEDQLGLPRLGQAGQAPPMTDLLASKPPPRLPNGVF